MDLSNARLLSSGTLQIANFPQLFFSADISRAGRTSTMFAEISLAKDVLRQ
jgi:hypothetical protein